MRVSHIISIVLDASGHQVNKFSFSEALVASNSINSEEFVPDLDKSIFAHAIITSSILVDNFFNFLDDFLHNFNFNNLFHVDWLLDDFFNLLNSILIDDNLLFNFFDLDSFVMNWNFNNLLYSLNLSNWNMNLMGLNLDVIYSNFNLFGHLMNLGVIDWNFLHLFNLLELGMVNWNFLNNLNLFDNFIMN